MLNDSTSIVEEGRTESGGTPESEEPPVTNELEETFKSGPPSLPTDGHTEVDDPPVKDSDDVDGVPFSTSQPTTSIIKPMRTFRQSRYDVNPKAPKIFGSKAFRQVFVEIMDTVAEASHFNSTRSRATMNTLNDASVYMEY